MMKSMPLKIQAKITPTPIKSTKMAKVTQKVAKALAVTKTAKTTVKMPPKTTKTIVKNMKAAKTTAAKIVKNIQKTTYSRTIQGKITKMAVKAKGSYVAYGSFILAFFDGTGLNRMQSTECNRMKGKFLFGSVAGHIYAKGFSVVQKTE
uniref:Uncharacterized protein n=1 Tax=Romanomermis culicivorax TaxID=13658 RepID=A0A915HLU8_ROMCU